MKRVIIPSATVVQKELQSVGKLPPVIYPVNENIVFDILYRQYQNDVQNIDVICYEKADTVHRRLKKYEDKRVRIFDLPHLKDLGYTIYFALSKDDSTPFILNFADTVVTDNLELSSNDAFFYQEDFVNEKWTYFEEIEGKITQIIDKRTAPSKDVKRLFVGVFQIMHPADFKCCLEKAFDDGYPGISTFYFALQQYSQIHPMKPLKAKDWYDLGHIDKYYVSLLEVKAREFNHITIDKNRGILSKRSDDKDKFIGEILWYLKLPKDLEYARPRIYDYSINYNDPFVSMEYYAYHTIHELFLYGDLDYAQWRKIFKRIKFLCDDFSRYTVNDKNIIPSVHDMYLSKTLSRINKMKDDTDFAPYFENNFSINGIKYKSLNYVEKILESTIPDILYNINSFNIIHGDLCFSNIMIDNNFNFIKVIDPRGKFGSFDIYGDERYELAKLFHSIDGKYDFIIKDLFTLNFDGLDYNYYVHDRVRNYDLYELMLKVFDENIKNKKVEIELIEALLFLSMIPLHGESKQHQFAMLATGMQILDRIVNIRV